MNLPTIAAPTTDVDRLQLAPITTHVRKQSSATATLTTKSTISVPTKSATSTTKVGNFFQATPAPSKILAGKRNAYDVQHRITVEDVAEEVFEVGNNFKSNGAILARQVEEHVSNDEGSAMLISYFGACASNTTAGWSCTKKRHQTDTLEGSPPKFLALGGSLQGAISPLPPIIAITLQGSLIILSCFLGLRSSTGVQTKLGKLFLILSFAAFSASLFAAVLFQSAAGMIYSAFITSGTVVVSKGSGGIALAWAGVFFTSLALTGVIILGLLADHDAPQGSKSHVNKRGGQDLEMPPIRDTAARGGDHNPVRGERPYLQGVVGREASSHKYSQQVNDMKRGKSPFASRWNMV